MDALSGPLRLVPIDKFEVWDNESINPTTFLHKMQKEARKIHMSSRVGLTIGESGDLLTQKRLEFVLRPYRFFVLPANLRKGIPNLIYGIYQEVLESESDKPGEWNEETALKFAAKVAQISGIKLNKIKTFVEEFSGGIKFGKECKIVDKTLKFESSGSNDLGSSGENVSESTFLERFQNKISSLGNSEVVEAQSSRSVSHKRKSNQSAENTKSKALKLKSVCELSKSSNTIIRFHGAVKGWLKSE
ncbi:hypothetical protein HK096_007382 [Nowakowskiella sp. JEL0078]|nr:hypothetical protein HK096_007382 [Nowakowskiella sp. JEL0078]